MSRTSFTSYSFVQNRFSQAGVSGVLKGVSAAVGLLRDWLADGGKIYIPVISEMFKLATGQDLKVAKALFFMLAIPVTYGLKLFTGKYPSQVRSGSGEATSIVE